MCCHSAPLLLWRSSWSHQWLDVARLTGRGDQARGGGGGLVISREELPLLPLVSLHTRSRRSGSVAAFCCCRSVWRVMGPLLGIDGIVAADADGMRLGNRPAPALEGLDGVQKLSKPGKRSH